MPLKRGSQYLLHFYTKLTNERNVHFIDYATWTDYQQKRASTSSSKYQFIDSDVEKAVQNDQRNSIGDDYQTIDSDDDFDRVYFKVVDDSEQPDYVVILPDDDNHSEYLEPVNDPDTQPARTYNCELPQPPSNAEGRDCDQDVFEPEDNVLMNSQQNVSSDWINQLDIPHPLLQSVDTRLKPNDHDVYDAIEADYNVPNQFRKQNKICSNTLDEKPDPQSCSNTHANTEKETPLAGRQQSDTDNQRYKENVNEEEQAVKPTAFALALEQILKEQNKRTKISQDTTESQSDEHDYENIETNKDENENTLPGRLDSTTYESMGDLNSPGYEDDVEFAVVKRFPISLPE